MSLNKLAWEMWEKRGYKEIDPSVLSRVINGERILNLNQLKVFASILKIPARQYRQLENEIFLEIASRYSIDPSFFEKDERLIVELLEHNVSKINELMLASVTLVAYEWSDELYVRIKNQMGKTRSLKNRKKLLELLAELIFRQSNLASQFQNQKDFLTSTLKHSRQLKSIGSQLKNKDLLGLADFRLGSAYYIDKKHEIALSLFKLGATKTSKLEYISLPLRESTLCLAYLGKEKEYDSLSKKILLDLPRYDANLQFQFLEGICRSEASLNRTKAAYDMLQKAKKVYENDDVQLKTKEVQLACAEMEIVQSSKSKVNKGHIQYIGSKAMAIAKESGYERYISKINGQLNDLLN